MGVDLSKLKEMVNKDLEIDGAELDLESLRIPQLHNKYLNIFTDEKLELSAVEFKYNDLLRKKWEYYTGKMSQEDLDALGWEPFQLNILKTDLEKYLSSDAELAKMKAKKVYQEQKLEYLTSILKAINNRQFHIRDAIAWRKFVNGVN
tara:strand:- start:8821 stop:9264 length:444 start_codon:yes stop_codon:yes gene_type:complete